jgi:hypothetical protein
MGKASQVCHISKYKFDLDGMMWMLKEVVVASSEVLSRHAPGETERIIGTLVTIAEPETFRTGRSTIHL